MATDRDPVRRDSFDSVAEAYDRGRPSYPEGLVDDLIAIVNIGEGSKVLEIGPGTGQLSVPLAKRGVSLVAVERGRNLANVARRKLSRFENADIVVADFDRWEAAPAAFDAVVAATAFHWLDPATRLARCAAILRPGGALAIIQTRWGVAQGEDPFFAASQACYARWDPKHDPAFRQIKPEEVSQPCDDLAYPEFAHVIHRRYLCAREYRAAQYCDLLATFSDVLALDERCRAGFLACISSLIDCQFSGRIIRHDLYDLCVSRRAG
jgi:SAM-dependent methyltransferase